jgi:hypothetical protein
MLQDDPATATAVILVRISQQLGSLTVSSAFANSTAPAISMEELSAPPASASIRINILWFFSLTLSLISALGAILVKQWLREYSLALSPLHPPDGMGLRQLRYDGLKRWGIPQLITSLPMLLQLAIALFLGGLVDLLWTLEKTIAITLTVLIVLCLLGMIATILLPSFVDHCAYKSPAAWAFLKSILICRGVLGRSLELLYGWLIALELRIDQDFAISAKISSTARHLMTTYRGCKSWADHDMIVLQASKKSHLPPSYKPGLTEQAIVWVYSRFGDHNVSELMGPCINALEPDQRVNVAFTIVAQLLGFSDVSLFRKLLNSDPGVIARHQWFWGSKAKQIGHSRELRLLLDFAPLASHTDTNKSRVSLLDIVILVQQLVRELPRRSSSFDAKYLRVLSGDLWMMDASSEFGNRVRKTAAKALLDFSTHDVKPRVDKDGKYLAD